MRKIASVTGAVLLGGVATLGLSAPAMAQPGSAEARGVVVDLAAEVGGVLVLDADLLIGSATAPPDEGTDTDLVLGVDLTALGVDLTAAVVETTATRGADESSAEATVTDLGLDLFGTDVLAAGAATAAVTCPAIGPQTADTELVGLTVFGDAVVLEANTPPVVVTGDVTVAGLAGAELQVSLSRIETVTDDGAVAAAIVADLTLFGEVLGVGVEIPAGTVIVAEATCERPLPPVPTAADITPDEGPQSGGQTVTVTGTGFVPGETDVTFDGVPATDVEVAADGTSLTAVTPPGEVGPADVVVTTPGGETDPLDYTYLADGSDAVVTDLDPTTGPTSGGTLVTITGSGFTGATGVTFDGVPGTDFEVDPAGEVITVVTPPNAAGPADVEVLFPLGEADAGVFTYVAAPLAPAATSIAPDAGPQSGGQLVTVTGAEFVPGETSVTFDGVPATDVAVAPDGTSLTAVTPPGEIGPAEVVVITPGGETDPLDYLYLADGSDVVVEDLDPDTGPTTGGTVVTIIGSGFDGAVGVTFGNTPGSGFAVSSDGTVISVVTPPGAAGSVPVEIVFPAGVAAAGDFTYVEPTPAAPPVIDDVDPGSGPTTGGTVVVIRGSGFVPGATTVTICDVTIPADQVVVGTDGSWLRFVTPPCPAGRTAVTVTTPAGESDAAVFRYTDRALPITGSAVSLLLATGAGLMTVGSGMLALVHRRRLLGTAAPA